MVQNVTTNMPPEYGYGLSFQPKFVGRRVPRVEDPILITGRAPHVDDIRLPDMLHVAFLRSPHAHARIVAVDIDAAKTMPGVAYVMTGAEIKNHLGPLGGFAEGWQGYPIAVDKVRYVGEPVAAVAATSRYLAEDAVRRIQVEYEPLPVVMNDAQALGGQTLLHEDKGSNVIFEPTYIYGQPDEALASADVIVRGTFRFPRVSGNPIEPNGCIAQFDPLTNTLTCWSNTQGPWATQMGLATIFGLPMNRVKVHAQPHGSSFGTRGVVKYIAINAIFSKLCGGRPVKYIEDRLEHLMGGCSHAWERRYEAEFGFTKDGECLAMKFTLYNDTGATTEGMGPTAVLKPLTCVTGPYRVRHVKYDVIAYVTNKCPEGAYRGYGPPPHFMVIEGMMDKAAAQLGIDRIELRRRNFIQPEEFPYKLPNGVQYDSGNYPEVLRTALAAADFDQLLKEQQRRRAEGKIVGLGVVFAIEPGGAWGFAGPYHDFGPLGKTPMPEASTILVDASGQLQVQIYHALEGQGQYTTAAQLVADFFGVPIEAVRVVQGEPPVFPPSFGPGGSRQAVTLTSAVLGSAERLREKLTRVAAHLLEAAPEDLELVEGSVRVKGAPQRQLTIGQIAGTMMFRPDILPGDVDGNPEVTYVWNSPNRSLEDTEASPYMTFANACHVVMVEIDPGTGKVSIPHYTIADDCGTRLNPMIVESMTQGGVAQGIGCALLEEYRYDDKGQLLTGTYMDYLMPTIYEVPMTDKHEVTTPSPFSPLGVKGAGEGAIHVTPAAVLCAVNDALTPLGLSLDALPATPDRLWRLINSSRQKAADEASTVA